MRTDSRFEQFRLTAPNGRGPRGFPGFARSDVGVVPHLLDVGRQPRVAERSAGQVGAERYRAGNVRYRFSAFPRFTGDTLEELLAWLRQILLNKVAEARRRYYRSQRRALAREANYRVGTDSDQMAMEQVGHGPTPHGQLVSIEAAEQISLAIIQTPERAARHAPSSAAPSSTSSDEKIRSRNSFTVPDPAARAPASAAEAAP